MKNQLALSDTFYQDIKNLISQAHKQVAQSINQTITHAYFLIGKRIVEEEQQGKARADYAKTTLKLLSDKLNQEFGRGFSRSNLEYMRKFYLIYKDQISQTLSGKSTPFVLSWSHYLFLCGIDNAEERKFYEIEAQAEKWSLRKMRRQFDSSVLL